MLPILPLVLMTLVASALYAIHRITSRKWIDIAISTHVKTAARYAVVCLFISSMFAYTLPLATIIHSESAPNIQLVEFVNSNYDPSETTIVVLHADRAFDFFGRQFRHVHCGHDVQKAVAITQSDSNSAHIVLTTSSAGEALRKRGVVLEVLKVAEFSRNPLVNTEDHAVVLFRILRISANETKNLRELH